MKRILCVLGLMTTLAANASMLEMAAEIQEKADVAGITINKDGSVTIREITVKRGDLTYPVGIQDTGKDFDSTCKLLGFDNSLSGDGLNTYVAQSGLKVVLKIDGSYETIKAVGHRIEKVTCLKGTQLKTVVLFNKIENEDKSFKITNISYLRGDLSFPVGIEDTGKDFNATCRLLGFENSLTGDGLNTYEAMSGSKVVLKADGSYDTIKAVGHKIEKLTCFSYSEPSLIVLVSGNRYIRIVP